jgi:hypothetical protein
MKTSERHVGSINPDDVFDLDEFRRIIRVSRPTAARLIAECKIHAIDIGSGRRKTYRISGQSVMAFLGVKSSFVGSGGGIK